MAARGSRVWSWTWRGALGVVVTVFGCLGYSWLTLPDARPLRTGAPTGTAFMRMREVEAQQAGKPVRAVQRWVPYARISPLLKRAVLVAEDAAFFDHEGIDFAELRASIETKLTKGGVMRGGSTITQQLAKNLYLQSDRNPYRKVVELMIARRLEAELPKTRIFELYLNLIEWGDGIWGAEAASRAYFGRSAADLTAEQAALLAGAIINPRIYSPARPNARLLRRQRIVLQRMGQPAVPTALKGAAARRIEPDDEAGDEGGEPAAAPPAP